jgi:hypothetical protein
MSLEANKELRSDSKAEVVTCDAAELGVGKAHDIMSCPQRWSPSWRSTVLFKATV